MKGGGSESQGQVFTAHEDAKRKRRSARWKAATVTWQNLVRRWDERRTASWPKGDRKRGSGARTHTKPAHDRCVIQSQPQNRFIPPCCCFKSSTLVSGAPSRAVTLADSFHRLWCVFPFCVSVCGRGWCSKSKGSFLGYPHSINSIGCRFIMQDWGGREKRESKWRKRETEFPLGEEHVGASWQRKRGMSLRAKEGAL